MTVRDFVPPIIIKVLKKFSPPKNNIPIPEIKYYSSYEEAQSLCIAGAYQNIELCNVVADKTVILRDSGARILNPTNTILLAALNQIIRKLQRLTVLDFGGACGAHYFEMRKYLPEDLPIKWIVVETPQMVLSAKSRQLESDDLIFSDNMDSLPNIDFTFSSGTLQSVSKPYDYLEMLLKLSAKYILFNRMMFNENDLEFITVQKSLLSHNGPGVLPSQYTDKEMTYPHTTLSFKKFNELVSEKYSLAWAVDEPTGAYPIGSEPIIGRGLFYTI